MHDDINKKYACITASIEECMQCRRDEATKQHDGTCNQEWLRRCTVIQH